MIVTRSIKECFEFDVHKYNKIPKSLFSKIFRILYFQRYSMPVLLRLTEYFHYQHKKKNSKLFYLFSLTTKRLNEIVNQFEHGFEHHIQPGVLFHHTGVTFPAKTRIDNNVQIFKNVTLALVKGEVCKIGEGSVIFSHVIILGKNIGKNCVIGAGCVVTTDIPDNSVVVGNPGRVVKTCHNASDYLEYI